VPADHPIRRINALADEALKRLDLPFDEMYEGHGTCVDPADAIAVTFPGTLCSIWLQRSPEGSGR
jgi:hypothetical protein